MSATADGGLRVIFREHLRAFGYDTLSIESRGTMTGVPDLNFCVDGIEGWIEFKRADARLRCTIRPAQIAWMFRRAGAGGRVFIAVRDDYGALRSRLWLYRGTAAEALAARALPEVLHLGCWTGGPSHWDWQELDRRLRAG